MNTAPTPPTPPLGVDAPWIALHARPPELVLVVSRLVNGAAAGQADGLLDALTGPAGTTTPLDHGRAVLHLHGPALPATPGRRRHVRGHLRWRGPHVVRSARVEVDLEPWADGVLELSLRPVARSATSWGPRRLRRWFHLSHLAADDLERRLRTVVAQDRARRAAALATAEREPAGDGVLACDDRAA